MKGLVQAWVVQDSLVTAMETYAVCTIQHILLHLKLISLSMQLSLRETNSWPSALLPHICTLE